MLVLTAGEGTEKLSVWEGEVVEVGFGESWKGPPAQRCEREKVEELHFFDPEDRKGYLVRT